MKNIEYVRPQDIEKRSFAIISQELEEKGMPDYLAFDEEKLLFLR